MILDQLMKSKRNNIIYGNCRVLSPKGDLMFLSTKKRADWYLTRNLAKLVENDPPTIQLTFQPNGEGMKDDLYISNEGSEKHPAKIYRFDYKN